MTSFLSRDEEALSRRFLEEGYVIAPCEDAQALQELVDVLLEETNAWMTSRGSGRSLTDLAASHQHVGTADLNDLRLHLFATLNSDDGLRRRYFDLAATLLTTLVGNELAMQTKVNLSIQQPDDPTSILDIHSDVWTGDSPFQVVLWTPLTDAADSNAMFFLPPRQSHEAFRRVRRGELPSMEAVRAAYAAHIAPVNIETGRILVFNSNCLHGNQLNTTTTSRWSLNCRFVSLLAPATNPERRLGSFYTPISARAATRAGLEALRMLEEES